MKAFQSFIDLLSSYQPVSTSLADYLAASVNEIVLPKHHLLLSQGELINKMWFLASGSARVIRWDDEALQENTVWVYEAKELIMPFEGVFSGQHATLPIVLNQQSTLLSLSFVHIQYLSRLFPEYHTLSQLIMESICSSLTNHLDQVQHRKIKERYHYLISHRPQLFQSISLKDIASFLGMSFSAIRHLRYGQ
ncbi:Crp/Fnr family transcriptional regulator [Pedobacter sp. SYP-B3415]|uniref:Crp/Fnr family transcriptional regulator n=1 Tax=Pedobacter sp. SYP-B3415 TaxID=2496641 RepID=UPI00101D2309|nr:Crp/Fnr family transcriptional regulator [Pedobacter sp. SYP-B3415]